MKNVAMAVSGNILTITVDLSKSYGPSASGKSTIIASTEGNQSVSGIGDKTGNGMKIGLNVYKH